MEADLLLHHLSGHQREGAGPQISQGAAQAGLDGRRAGEGHPHPLQGAGQGGGQVRAAVSPTTMTAGGRTPARSAAWGSCSSGARTAAGWGAQPPETTAAGVSGARPAAISRWTMAGSWERPMRMTRVPSTPASRSSWSETPSFVWAVITWKLRLSPRWVTGMPAWPGMAMAEEIRAPPQRGRPPPGGPGSPRPPGRIRRGRPPSGGPPCAPPGPGR